MNIVFLTIFLLALAGCSEKRDVTIERINNQINKCIDQKINEGYSERDAEKKCDGGY
jgi:hypothetical protein